MTINRFNYEAFALDYLEGNLSKERAEEMERFLQTHPAIEAELSGMMEMVILEPDTSIVFENKAALLKEEKVVFLNLKWVRPLIAAASIALLFGVFYLGYRAGVNNADAIVVDNGKSSSQLEEKFVTKTPDKLVTTPIKEEAGTDKKDLIKETQKKENQLENTVVKTEISKTNKPLNNFKIIKNTPTPIIKNHPTEIISTPIEKIAQVAKNQLITKETKRLETPKSQASNLPVLIVLNVNFNSIKSMNDTLNDLNKALAADLEIDQKWLANSQKKKRSFKDLLGKFPINNLREALIPTYYKEESAGQ